VIINKKQGKEIMDMKGLKLVGLLSVAILLSSCSKENDKKTDVVNKAQVEQTNESSDNTSVIEVNDEVKRSAEKLLSALNNKKYNIVWEMLTDDSKSYFSSQFHDLKTNPKALAEFSKASNMSISEIKQLKDEDYFVSIMSVSNQNMSKTIHLDKISISKNQKKASIFWSNESTKGVNYLILINDKWYLTMGDSD